jgi:hypothetical protein
MVGVGSLVAHLPIRLKLLAIYFDSADVRFVDFAVDVFLEFNILWNDEVLGGRFAFRLTMNARGAGGDRESRGELGGGRWGGGRVGLWLVLPESLSGISDQLELGYTLHDIVQVPDVQKYVDPGEGRRSGKTPS